MTGCRLDYAHGPSRLIQEMAKLEQSTSSAAATAAFASSTPSTTRASAADSTCSVHRRGSRQRLGLDPAGCAISEKSQKCGKRCKVCSPAPVSCVDHQSSRARVHWPVRPGTTSMSDCPNEGELLHFSSVAAEGGRRSRGWGPGRPQRMRGGDGRVRPPGSWPFPGPNRWPRDGWPGIPLLCSSSSSGTTEILDDSRADRRGNTVVDVATYVTPPSADKLGPSGPDSSNAQPALQAPEPAGPDGCASGTNFWWVDRDERGHPHPLGHRAR
jgi:hypothetical protein